MELPEEPNPDDCCNSGCNPCILDVYEEQLKLYRQKKEGQNLEGKKSCILPAKLSIFRAVNIEKHTENTFFYTFEFAGFHNDAPGKNYDDFIVKFTAGQHFFVKGKNWAGEEFSKAYTPLKLANLNEKQFAILIKLYRNGEMSRFFRNMKINQKTLWRGPYGDYTASYMYKNMLFIAQGTGIAPFHEIIEGILKNEDCCTFLKLFFCCRSCNDILMRNALKEFSRYWNFTYEVFLSDFSDYNCKYNEVVHKEKLSRKHFDDYIAKTGLEHLQILICGSEQFIVEIKDMLGDINCNIVTF